MFSANDYQAHPEENRVATLTRTHLVQMNNAVL